ncbi:MAG: DNA polymerase III subunit alpha, partial [Lachnospiraceae bacterium]
ELGLLKMDFLGLRTLTVIQDAVDLVNRQKKAAGEPLLDLGAVDYNDPKVMEMISRGKCEGVFQLESAGMKAFMKQLKPQTLEDIIAGISLYRPGPMDFIPKYIAGKEDPASITYDCEEMRPILEKTYGCIVYQEQVMQIVRDLGGYSFGRSDLIRRAMSKKKADVMAKERQNFVYGNKEMGVGGCQAKGISESVANHIFDEMTDFASYAFNKSHAAAYAVVSFRTAYLKCYHPVEFMAALMTSVIEHPDKCAAYILHCKDMDIPVLPPSVNTGYGRFTTEGNSIRYGMYAIRSAGRGVIDRIVEEREKNGRFRNLADFVRRMSGREINRRAVENLIKAGALDDFPGNRRQKVLVFPAMMDQEASKSKNAMAGQMTFLDFLAPEEQEVFEIRLPDVEEFPAAESLAYEKEVLGVYLSGHPLEEYRDVLKRYTTNVTSDFLPDEETGEPLAANGTRTRIGGMISGITIKYTRNNQVMAFVTIEDLLGTVEVLVFPKPFERYRDILVEDNKVIIEGRVSAEDERPSKVICDKVIEFCSLPRAVWVAFSDRFAYETNKKILLETVSAAAPGIDRVVAFLKSSKALMDVTRGRKVSAQEELITALRGSFGEENVAILADRPKMFGE